MGAKKVKALRRHELNFNSSLEFFKNALAKANTLSDELLKEINFEKGCFFALLPEGAFLENLYDFRTSILPQNPTEEYFVDNKMSTYSIIPTINKEVSDLILNHACNNKLNLVFDDVNSSYREMSLHDHFCSFRKNYNKEVYLLLENNSISKELILDCLLLSNAFWHSLCVLTLFPFDGLINRELSYEKIKNICLTTVVVIVGAYDGEGYVFWENSDLEMLKNKEKQIHEY